MTATARLLLTVLTAVGIAGDLSPAAAQVGDIAGHDPAIMEHEGIFYIFSTGPGIPIKRSRDLVQWENAGAVFDEMPGWVADVVPRARGSLWAPDISFFNGRYHLYYSASSFGSQRSAIGLATNVTLDPSDPRYRWEDHGPVVRSTPGESTFNAIDPNLALDAEGQPWLNWGSFWGGIKMRRIDPATGRPSDQDTTLYSLAARRGTEVRMGPDNDQSVEGSFVVRRGAYYYLFVSFDMCCRGVRSTYNIRVGRAERITGPYLDERGEPMTEGAGNIVLASAGDLRGPGHNSVLQRGDEYYLVHHYYDAGDHGRSKIQIRPLAWEDDWPIAGHPLSAAAKTGEAPPERAEPPRVHDPVIIRQGDSYYLFSTGNGIPVRRSRDLIEWETLPPVFADLPDMLPGWAAEEVPGVRNPWAPDIIYFNGRYHLYYSLSTFGGNRSVIGLATTPTLDPDDPRFRWEDRGKVVESFPGVSDHNAIDPNVVLDGNRQPWLSWGSFWGGVKMRKLDPASGLPSREDTTTYALAARITPEAVEGNNRPRSVEAPFIIRRGEYYYQFLSFDRCCIGARSTYNIRVGRSREVTGPYVDEHGIRMTRGGGTVVLAGQGRIRGPGHNAILVDGEDHLLVHHFYDAEDRGRSKLQIRPLIWKEDGWPVAGEPLVPLP